MYDLGQHLYGLLPQHLQWGRSLLYFDFDVAAVVRLSVHLSVCLYVSEQLRNVGIANVPLSHSAPATRAYLGGHYACVHPSRLNIFVLIFNAKNYAKI